MSKSRLRLERDHQLSLGYDLEHDRQMGQTHLISWAFRYFLNWEFVKGGAMLLAAWESRKGVREWAGESDHHVTYYLRAKDAKGAHKIFKKRYGEEAREVWELVW